MWDDYYGKQRNPYSVEDLKMILDALEDSPERYSPAMQDLIERTRKALEIEQK